MYKQGIRKAQNERFTVHHYRRDLAHLEFKVVDSEHNQVVDDAMTEVDAQELADSLNILSQDFGEALSGVVQF